MKMNSVTDIDFIKKIAEACVAGVRVQLIIRGICCILPGIPEKTDNLEIISIVGRYLEHARIFSFGNGAEQKIYIGSADMMTRNTEKRVEVAVPVLDIKVKAKINHMLHVMLSDNVKARRMTSDGTYQKIQHTEQEATNSQEIFMEEALRASEKVKMQSEKVTFWKKILGKIKR